MVRRTPRSRHCAPNELARQLVDAGIIDRPMVIRYRGLAGTTTWGSFQAAATWTYSEGDQPLCRVRYKEQPEGLFLRSGDAENAFHRPPDDIVVVPGTRPPQNGVTAMRFMRRRFLAGSPMVALLLPRLSAASSSPAPPREIGCSLFTETRTNCSPAIFRRRFAGKALLGDGMGFRKYIPCNSRNHSGFGSHTLSALLYSVDNREHL
jgi:hypothetical protein